MATYTYIPVRAAITTTPTDIYTVPAGKTAMLLTAQAANIDGAAVCDVTAAVGGATKRAIASTVPVPADAALGLITGPVALDAAETIRVTASANGDLEFVGSVMEITP